MDAPYLCSLYKKSETDGSKKEGNQFFNIFYFRFFQKIYKKKNQLNNKEKN